MALTQEQIEDMAAEDFCNKVMAAEDFCNKVCILYKEEDLLDDEGSLDPDKFLSWYRNGGWQKEYDLNIETTKEWSKLKKEASQ